MSSLNLGETQGKPDFEILFEDFPNAVPELARIIAEGDYKTALSICVLRVGWDEVLKAREYGANKYAKDNWLESKGTNDHDNFMAANKRSIYRHIAAYESMVMIDKESGCKHLAMVALRCMIAIEYGVATEAEGTSDNNVAPELDSSSNAPLYEWKS